MQIKELRDPVPASGPGLAGAVVIAFGTTVGMWAAAYVGRIPTVMLPTPWLVALLALCMLAGGVWAGRRAGGGVRVGLAVGAIVGVLNLLVLGSVISGDHPGQIVPTALLWVPGSVLGSALVVGVGAWLGSLAGRPVVSTRDDWTPRFVRVAVVATMLLLAVGGLVTSKEAGLAVVDWPNSYGYNMFLFPLSRMTGGVYYEHAHRLFGALVGLTTLALAVFVQRREPRAFVRRLAWAAVVLVVVQGVLGGLRVTGRFTMSMTETMEPNITLAVVHGVLAQVFFALLVALAAFTSGSWRKGPPPEPQAGAGVDRVLGWVVLLSLIAQLVLGAIQRHTQNLLLIHVAMAAFVAPLAISLGFRTWGRHWGDRLLQGWGLALVGVTMVQVLLGIGAFFAVGALGMDPASVETEVLVTTLHQWCGAMLLGAAVLVHCWNHRRVRPA